MSAIDELVRISGYSRSTVFRFLAGKPVRPAAEDAIRTASRAIGFRKEAREPREDAAILLSVPPDFRGFRGFADAAEGAMRRAAERGVPIVFDEAHAGARRIAAVVLGMGEREEDEERRRRRERGEPCVLVNRMVEDGDASWASVDFRAAAAEAVAHLAAAGCRRIACFVPGENRRVDKQKAEGAARAGAEKPGTGLEVVFIDPAERSPEEAAGDALGRSGRPDGWLAFSDEEAMRVIRAADKLGIRVPADLSVVGMNDTEGAAFFSPAITTVRVPFAACGEAAVDAALRLLDYPDELSVRIALRHALIERESCAPVR